MALLDIFPHVNLATIVSWLVCWEKKAGRVVLRRTPIEKKRKENDRHRFSHSFSKLTSYTRRHEPARRVQGRFRVESRDLMERGIQEREDQGSVHVFRSVSVNRGAVDIEFDYQRLGFVRQLW
ncbi:uncharacterized protein FFB14_09366 [Fusarium fujikuroi]|nr:uncharacterized protein FFB14_09366 [Fusarium fujikuroi]